jgi:hypothetical protein
MENNRMYKKHLPVNIETMKKTYNNSEVKSLVSTWLLQKAYSEIVREKVNSVYADVLAEIPIFDDFQAKHKDYKSIGRILTVNDMYLSNDLESCNKIYIEVDKRLKEKGIKPLDMKWEFCPALTEESKLTDIEHKIIKLTGSPFGVTVDKLLMYGLDSYNKWIDLSIKVIVNMPDFKNPITNELVNKG